MDKFVGKKLDGRYEIVELIGVGGMADVYKAKDIMENRVVAVKILKSELSDNDEFVRRFRNESKAIAVLSHPNIVRIFDVGYENDMQYIVMEYIDGITLKEYIEQQGLLKWRDCVHFTIQILRALQLAHDRGIVHRDIKPQNVMLMSDGSIKVMDFGIAMFSRQDHTLSEKTMGSVHYVSPEQARGTRTDEKSDIYSVGVMMYEMLTGRKPFDGDTPVSVALKHMNEEPPKPSTYVSSLYEGLEEIILHAMEKESSKRYQSASEMIRDIETFKMDQSATFGYSDVKIEKTAQTAGVLGGVKSLADKLPKIKKKPKKEKPVKVVEEIPEEEYYYDEEYDEDDDDYEPRPNFILPILAAVTVTVIIVATLFVANVILGAFKTAPSSSNDYVMPQLIGKNYYDARASYTEIQLVASEEFNSQYEAGVIIAQEKAEGRIVKKGDTIKVTVSKGTRMVSVPDVKNYHYNSAYAALTGEDLMVMRIEKESDDVPAGYVLTTDPASGTVVEEKTTIRVYVSLGPSTEDTVVPDVTGKTVEEADSEITRAYLEPKIQYVESSEPEGIVISQNIAAGDTVTRGTIVTIYVSDGTGTVSDPFEDDFIVDPEDDIPGFDFGFEDDDVNGGAISGQVTIDLEISTTARSAYFIKFVNQNTMQMLTDDIFVTGSEAGSSISVTLKGSGSATVIAEVRGATSGVRTTLAVYEVDFATGTYYCTDYFSSAFTLVDLRF